MKFKDPAELKEEALDIGGTHIVKLSAIRSMSISNMPLEGVVAIARIISGIEANLWALVPLSFEIKKHQDVYDEAIKNIHEGIDDYMKALEAMQLIMKI